MEASVSWNERVLVIKVKPYAGQRLVTVLVSSINWIGFEGAVKDD
jgi:hypothetical protein